MPITASDITTRASTLLLDTAAVRWPVPELLNWLNDGLRELAILKPGATGETKVLELARGTKQVLPDQYSALIRVIRNVTGPNNAPVGVGGAVTIISREMLDAVNLHWHDPTKTPFRAVVRHVILDPFEQQTFYTFPGNTGAGKIEVFVSAIPAEITQINQAIPIPATYRSALVDFVMYRALSKDLQLAGAAARATAHWTQFTTALGVKGQNEGAFTPNTTK
jgi:hypothetical protein